MTYEEREAALGRMMMKRRIEEMGQKWFDEKREREAAAIDLYRKNKEGGVLGGRNKHVKYTLQRGIPKKPHDTTIKVNRMILKGKTNKEIASEIGVMPKTVGAIIRRNNLPREDL